MRRVSSERLDNLHKVPQLQTWQPTYKLGSLALELGFYLPHHEATHRVNSNIRSQRDLLNHPLENVFKFNTKCLPCARLTQALQQRCQRFIPFTQLTAGESEVRSVFWVQVHHSTADSLYAGEMVCSKSHMTSLWPKYFQDNWQRSNSIVQFLDPQISPCCIVI